uniref:Uncharacterized protein n=1 Tax=Cacopsylla melanoneura TaxID=428564 RepID=A0A8D9EAN8_9HEMI
MLLICFPHTRHKNGKCIRLNMYAYRELTERPSLVCPNASYTRMPRRTCSACHHILIYSYYIETVHNVWDEAYVRDAMLIEAKFIRRFLKGEQGEGNGRGRRYKRRERKRR